MYTVLLKCKHTVKPTRYVQRPPLGPQKSERCSKVSCCSEVDLKYEANCVAK